MKSSISTVIRQINHARLARAILLVNIITYMVFFSALGITRYYTQQNGLDAAFYEQAIWNTAHGRPFALTLIPEITHKMADHIQPTIALFAPLYWLPRSHELFIILVVVIMASGAFPLFAIARAQLRNPYLALTFALAYLFYPSLEAASITDFHAVNLTAPLFLWALSIINANADMKPAATGAFFILLTLAMGCREEVALSTVAIGVYIFLILKRRELGIITALFGVVWFAAAMGILMPYFRPGGTPHTRFYSQLGSNLTEIIATVFTQPLLIIQTITAPPKIAYLRKLLTPIAFLPLFSLTAALPGMAAVLLNLLSDASVMHTTENHYVAPLIPFIFYASIYGARNIIALAKSKWARHALVALIMLGIGAGSLYYHHRHGFTPLYADFSLPRVTKHHRLLDKFRVLLPRDAGVTTQYNLVTRLAQREHIYTFPWIDSETDYILLDVTHEPGVMAGGKVYRAVVQELLDGDEFGVITAEDGYILLKRCAGTVCRDTEEGLPDEFYDFARVPEVQPQFPMTVDFGDKLRLIGIDYVSTRRCFVQVNLYWQALNELNHDYDFDLWLHDAEGNIHWQQGTKSTTLWYPTSSWRRGERVIVWSQTIPVSQLGVGYFSLHIPLASDDAQKLRPRVQESALFLSALEYGTALTLPQFRCEHEIVKTAPVMRQYITPKIEHNLAVNFDDKILLHGYDTPREEGTVYHSGESLCFTLHWQAIGTPLEYYNVFIHVLAENGERAAQFDAPPLDGNYPTTWWARGEVIADARRVVIPKDIPPGEYAVWIGLYDLDTMQRLAIIDTGSEVRDNAVLLMKAFLAE